MKGYYQSPIGAILLESSDSGIRKLIFTDEEKIAPNDGLDEILTRCIAQLNEYFTGKRKDFDLPLDLMGTTFQRRVWAELMNIPFGTTISYKELAIRLGDVKAIRAAGTANGANPVSIIVPCHRVIGSNGSLIGYGGGLWRKQWLLGFEEGDAKFQTPSTKIQTKFKSQNPNKIQIPSTKIQTNSKL